jgi:signal peptidase I
MIGEKSMDDKKKYILKEVISWVMVVVVAFTLSILVNRFVLLKVVSPTGSMENTFMVGEPVYTFRLAYLFSDPKRGDIVVFPNPDDESEDYIKRIIGLPGETIEGIDGVVYINGEPLTENYLKEPMEGEFGPYDIPEGCYFMMGDNRNESLDARYWINKFVEKDKIKSRAFFKWKGFKWFKRIKY